MQLFSVSLINSIKVQGPLLFDSKLVTSYQLSAAVKVFSGALHIRSFITSTPLQV
jgi:hypothetical protein